jgi:hypothetical protein
MATPRTIDPVSLPRLRHGSYRPLSRIGCHAVPAQVPGKLPSPFPQRGFPDVQPRPVVAHRLDDHVHVGVGLIGMKYHRVPILRPELAL